MTSAHVNSVIFLSPQNPSEYVNKRQGECLWGITLPFALLVTLPSYFFATIIPIGYEPCLFHSLHITMSTSSSPQVERLDSTNYQTWKSRMRYVLEDKDIWEVVSGEEEQPTIGEEEEDDTALKEWKKKDKKARTTIGLALSDSELLRIDDAETSHQAWQLIRDAHEMNAPPRRMYLRQQFFTERFREDSETMQEYIDKMLRISNQLKAIGSVQTDEDMAVQLLFSLPESYANLVVALTARDDMPSAEQVRSRLLQEERRRKSPGTQQEVQQEGTALYVKQKGNKKQQSKTENQQGSGERANKNVKCFHCGKLGHRIANCRKKIAEDKSKNGSSDKSLIAAAFRLGTDTNSWFVDSGATGHFSSRREWFYEYTPTQESEIVIANGATITVMGKGNIKVQLEVDGKLSNATIKDVSYVPNLYGNLISVTRLTAQGNKVVFEKGLCRIFDKNGEPLALAEAEGNLYRLKAHVQEVRDAAKLTSAFKANTSLWHRRLGHLSESGIKQLATKNLVSDLDIDNDDNLPLCEGCIFGKQHRSPFPKKGATRAKEILEIVHTDVCGPMESTSYGGSRYFVTFIDDKTRKMFIYFLKTKDEVFNTFQDFKAFAEKQTGKNIKILRSDNGGEYISRAFDGFLKSQGIRHHTTVAYTPEQNGVAERANRTIVERARSMLHDQSLPHELWAEASSTAVYLINRSPTKALTDMTPEEAWTGTKPSISHLRTFGCRAYAHVPKQKRSKFDRKAIECIFVGYPDNVKGYKLFNPDTKTVINSRDVTFDELGDQEPPNLDSSKANLQGPQRVVVSLPDTPSDDDAHTDDARGDDASGDDANGDNDNSDDDDGHYDSDGRGNFDEDDDTIVDDEEPEGATINEPRRSGRERRPPSRFSDYIYLTGYTEEEPTTYAEAISRSDSKQWEQAARTEYDSLITNKTWKLVDLPPGRKAIGCKWVFKIKYDSSGKLERYKARLVAKGYSQTQGIDYNETFAPVAKFNSIRTLIALAAEHDLELHQMDVKTAFLNGHLDEEIYMEQPEGFSKKNQEHKVCKLSKSLYGLKQAGRSWYQMIDANLTDLGFERTSADVCIYHFQKDGVLMVVALYVDDLLLLSNNLGALDDLKKKLGKRFDMKDLGPAQFILGIQIRRNRVKKVISISQEQYIDNILKRFGMEDCKPIATPLDANTKFSSTMSPSSDKDFLEMKEIPYQQAIGSLMYAMLGTRPDIAFAVGALSRFSSNPGMHHWQGVKRIFRYLKGTKAQCLRFQADKKELVGYCDADWGGDRDDRKSTGGYAFLLAGGAISWSSKKQPTVALSTTEAEYMAVSQGTREAIWLRRLLHELGFGAAGPVRIFNDNLGCVALTRNAVYHARTKHIDIQHHFVREKVECQEVDVRSVGTDGMVADIMTKGLGKPKHVAFSSLLGLTDMS